jgi:hypothetical protein
VGRRKGNEKIKKINKKSGTHIWRGNGGPPEMEGEVGIWSGMQNGGFFRGPAVDGFLHQTSKFWSRGPYRGPAGDALMPILPLFFNFAILPLLFQIEDCLYPCL